MRALVTVVTVCATLALIGASCAMNWKFMVSLGKSDFEQQIFGAVSVAVSVFIALLPTLILWAVREKRFGQAVVGLPVFLAFVAFSLSSAVGFAAKNRGSQAEDRTAATAHLEEVRRDLAEAELKRKSLGDPRSAGVIEVALRSQEQDRKWQWSRECQNAMNEAERAFCKAYFELKAEGARAAELSTLEAKIVKLKQEARTYEAQGAGRQADSQAAVLASLLGVPPLKVERGMTLFLALLIETGAAFGLYLATGHMRHEPKRPSSPSREDGKKEPVKLKVVPEAVEKQEIKAASEAAEKQEPVKSEPVALLEAPRKMRRVPKIQKGE